MNKQLQKIIGPSGLGAIFGLSTLLLNTWAHEKPTFIEYWYSRGLYQNIRCALNGTFGQLPFPAFYLFWIAVLFCLIFLYRRRTSTPGFWPKFKYWLARLGGLTGLLVGLFFWLWGFNFARIPLDKQIGLIVQPVDSAVLWQELRKETLALDSLRATLIGNDTAALNDKKYWPIRAEDTIRVAVEEWLVSEGFPVGCGVRGRFIHPEGTLFLFGAAGIYWPFVGEGNIEAGLHPLRKLPSMAHEMSHGYGFCDEGVCNFIAYAACSGHTNTYIAYCSRLDYWSTLSRACWRSDPKRYISDFAPGIPPGIRADEAAIRLQHRRFKELAPELRYEVYDAYLKGQGIASGMLNYDEVLMLVIAWRKNRLVPL